MTNEKEILLNLHKKLKQVETQLKQEGIDYDQTRNN